MIAALPHDVQAHVWDLYMDGLQTRIDERHRRAATKVVEQIAVLCNHDAAACGYLLDWAAHMLQHPADKPGVAVVLVGRESCGKNMLVHLLSRLVPTLHTRDPRRDVYGRHNPLMAQAQLVVIEDAARIHAPSFKSLLSDETIIIRERHRPHRVAPSCHRVLLLEEMEEEHKTRP